MKALQLSAERAPREEYVVSPYEKRTGIPANGSRIYRHPKLSMIDLPIPTIAPKQMLVRVKACGICAGDLMGYRTDEDGYMLLPGRCKLPVVLGHELSGEVAEVGSAVEGFQKGDMVISEMNLWCGKCPACREGMVNQCHYERELGWTLPGGFEEYVALEAKYCWKINSLAETYGDREKAFEAGALVEPTSVAYNAIVIRTGGIRPGDVVVVHGAGPVGLAAVALSRASGAANIICFQPSEVRRELAVKMGADHVLDPFESKEQCSTHEKIMDLTKGLGADIHIEASGSSKIYSEIEESLATGGKLIKIGMVKGPAPIDLAPYQFQGGMICASIGNAGHGIWPRVIRLMAGKRIDMTSIVTSRFPLEQAVEALERAVQKKDGKILVKQEKKGI